MVAPITVYSSTSGLNTVLDPERLASGGESPGAGIELAEAVNVAIDDRGLIELRKGVELLQAGKFHSLFCGTGSDCYVVHERTSDAAIMQVAEDGSLKGVRSGLSKNRRMAWLEVNGDVFYSNGVQNGFIRNGRSNPWKATPHTGPEADWHFEDRVPHASHIAFRPGGQMLLADGPAVWINHEPFQFGLWSKAQGYIGFDSDVTMLAVVRSGFFASDRFRTWFFRKLESGWYHYQQSLVDNAPALLGSLAYNTVALQEIGIEQPGFACVWATTEGLVLGADDGSIIKTSKAKLRYPEGKVTGTCIVHDNIVYHYAR